MSHVDSLRRGARSVNVTTCTVESAAGSSYDRGSDERLPYLRVPSHSVATGGAARSPGKHQGSGPAYPTACGSKRKEADILQIGSKLEWRGLFWFGRNRMQPSKVSHLFSRGLSDLNYKV